MLSGAVCSKKLATCNEPMIGKTIEIAGMVIEVLADKGDSWECRNLTTRQIMIMKKAVIERAIKLGQAVVVMRESGRE